MHRSELSAEHTQRFISGLVKGKSRHRDLQDLSRIYPFLSLLLKTAYDQEYALIFR